MEGFPRALVALIAVGNIAPVLPVVLEFTSQIPPREVQRYRTRALLEANVAAVAFLLFAPLFLGALALTVNDLRIAGGLVLLVYATHDLLFSRARRNRMALTDEHEEQADEIPPIAPLGIPILVGPATLSMLLVLSEVHGTAPVLAAMAINLALNLVLMRWADRLLAFAGDGASRAVGKVMSLVLATLGAGMLRAGIQGALAG